MKSFLTMIYAVGCIVFLAISHYYWTNQTTVHTAASNQSPEESHDDQKPENDHPLLLLTKNWPEKGVEDFKQALENKQPFKIVIVGSTALGGDEGWAMKTKTNLLESYGAEILTVDIIEYDSTSSNFVESEKLAELVAFNGNMILLEPFILNDNAGLIKIDDSLANVSLIVETVKNTNPEAVFLLQPSHPIFQATRYPVQISELKQYATTNDINFLDHWTSWPNPNDEEVKDYLNVDQSAPNDKGHQLWSEFISDYLISK